MLITVVKKMDSEYSNSWYFNSENGHLSLVSDAGEITIGETDIEAASVSRHVKVFILLKPSSVYEPRN